ncbi:hypothetical protein MMC17_006800 [Xylographa soralifera]|nr:hypothetical protein [Xylographa soralifera]
MENIMHPDFSILRRHRRARHEVAAQEGHFFEHETTQPTAIAVEAQGHNISALSEYDEFGGRDEATLGFHEDIVKNEASLPEDEDTLLDDGFGPPDWASIFAIKHNNRFSQISPSRSIYRVETEDEGSVLCDDEADDAATSFCTDPEEEEEEEEEEAVLCEQEPSCQAYDDLEKEAALHCFPEPLCQAYDDRSRIFSPRMPLGPGWLSTFINTPTSRGDREAKDADWESIIEEADFEVEDCHNFITLELGQRKQIPMKYEYSQAIEEVHRRLRHRYGDADFMKAIEVFHNIMQFKDADLVHSDEAPEWNSWRGEYKKRMEDATKVIALADLGASPVPHGLPTVSHQSDGSHLASHTKSKATRSRRTVLKIVKNAHKKGYQDVDIPTGRDVTKVLANASFMKNLKPNPVMNVLNKCTSVWSSGKSSSMTKEERAERAERKKIAPWDKHNSAAPAVQGDFVPAYDQDPRAPSVPLVPGPHTAGRVAALKNSKSTVSFKPVKKSKSSISFRLLMKKKSSVAVQTEQAASAKGLGLTFGTPDPAEEEVRVTFITPPTALGADVPRRSTQLQSTVHFLTPEEHTAAAQRREGRQPPGLRHRRQQNAERTPEIADQVEKFRKRQREADSTELSPFPEKAAEQGSEHEGDPYDHPLTPLLPESILLLPESNITNRRRVVKPTPDDDFDDTVVYAPRPRVSMAQRNEDFGWHVPGEAQVRLRPRRVPDPMTPSPELMEHVRPRHNEDRFNPELFGLGRRRRPENVLITQHKVKQVYIQQPGVWTPKFSEINF